MEEPSQRINLSTKEAAEFERLLREVSTDWPDDPMNLSSIAGCHGFLPLSLDAGGVVGLKRDGSIVCVNWEDPGQEKPIVRARERDSALIDGATRYEFLKALLPVRSSNEDVCSECRGTGKHPLAVAANVDNVVCLCTGLGWIPGDWEEL